MDLQLDPRKTALVLIDLQGGILGLPLAPYDRAAVVGAAARLGQAFAAAGAPIVTVRVGWSDDLGDLPPQQVDRPIALPPEGMTATWFEPAPEIAALPATASILKRHWSAFHGTELDLQLRRRGVGTLVLGGVATNFGVESTAREAWQHGYAVVVAEDACSSLGEPLHRFAVEWTLPRVSRVRSVAEVTTALGAA
ncbi:Nicotinamidase-related amidase [Tistlia consotensis]|uniref:Nicotinamidase-related amidase n=1 Tax=Tistlia consotensis USBA 355 TaxID=560819 RepID=A0A1Y6CCF2_9PROT|nr:hydrolase [Tistlia consotensis]SMF56766.1 Nicotinamidase-related amidase [Tistlia consotensis USBA 355]SNR45009.1 Nicotinamidase-related amidase [Tistlia consotensis]